MLGLFVIFCIKDLLWFWRDFFVVEHFIQTMIYGSTTNLSKHWVYMGTHYENGCVRAQIGTTPLIN